MAVFRCDYLVSSATVEVITIQIAQVTHFIHAASESFPIPTAGRRWYLMGIIALNMIEAFDWSK